MKDQRIEFSDHLDVLDLAFVATYEVVNLIEDHLSVLVLLTQNALLEDEELNRRVLAGFAKEIRDEVFGCLQSKFR